MGTSNQEVVATLKSCLPIYHNLFDLVGYQLTEDELDRLRKFHRLWESGQLDDDRVLEQAGIRFDEFVMLVGYVEDLKGKNLRLKKSDQQN